MTLTEREACKPGMLTEALAREAGIEGEVRMLVTRTALLGEDEYCIEYLTAYREDLFGVQK